MFQNYTNAFNVGGTHFINTTLIEGEYSTVSTQILYVKKIATCFYYETCYQITTKSDVFIKHYTIFGLHINESIPYDELPHIKIHITSEKNAYGVIANAWTNGRVLNIHTQIQNGISKLVDLKPKKYNYLTTNSNCSNEPFYECFSRLFAKSLNKNQTKCSPCSMPSLPTCNLNDTNYEVFWSMWSKVAKNPKLYCPKLCSTLEYSGEVTTQRPALRNTNFTLVYDFLSSDTTTVYNEYLIYDAITMIGSVGGTLGMCIGFSFSGVISNLINIFVKCQLESGNTSI